MDVFKVTFEALHLALQDDRDSRVVEQLNKVVTKLDEAFDFQINENYLAMAVENSAEVKSTRALILNQLKQDILNNIVLQESVKSAHLNCRDGVRGMTEFNLRRLQRQGQAAERKLKELVMEVHGEYAKSALRITRRQQFVNHRCRANRVKAVWKLLWNRFCTKLISDVISYDRLKASSTNNQSIATMDCILTSLLSLSENAGEFTKLTTKVSPAFNHLLGSRNWKIISIVRFVKKSSTEGGNGAGNNSKAHNMESGDILAMSTLQDFAAVSAKLRSWMSFSNSNETVSSNNYKTSRNNLHSSNSQRRLSNSSAGTRNSHQQQFEDEGITGLSGTGTGGGVTPLGLLKFARFLSAQSVQWMHPPSYFPMYFDSLYKSCKKPIESECESQMESFLERFSLQHTSSLFNDRLYYCLEERALSWPSLTASTAADCDPNIKAIFGLLDALQSIYAEKYVSMAVSTLVEEQRGKVKGTTTTRSSLSESLLLTLRMSLNEEPMAMTQYMSSHRDVHTIAALSRLSKTSNREFGQVKELLQGFPDVIKVTTLSGSQLHFAPCMSIMLPESAAFAQTSPNSDQIRYLSSIFPHPQLSLLSRPSSAAATSPVNGSATGNIINNNASHRPIFSPLCRLFCLISVNSSHADYKKAFKLFVSEDTKNDPMEHSAASNSLPIKVEMFMMPLADECMREVIRVFWWSSTRDSAMFDSNRSRGTSNASDLFSSKGLPPPPTLQPNNEQLPLSPTESVPEILINEPASFAHLLPDHSRWRSSSSRTNADNTSLQQQLCNKYIFLSESFLHKSELSADSWMVPCYYLLQLSPVDEKLKNLTENPTDGKLNTEESVFYPENNEFELCINSRKLFEADNEVLMEILNDNALETSCPGHSLRGKTGNVSKLQDQVGNNDDEQDDDEEMNQAAASGRKKRSERPWDPTLLSSVCRWRSCFCEAVGATDGEKNSSNLCSFHLELKRFVDRSQVISTSSPTKASILISNTNSNESSKYLPKSRAPQLNNEKSEASRDYSMIRAASTLLIEMNDGKLKATLQAYLKKLQGEFGFKSRLRSGLFSSSFPNSQLEDLMIRQQSRNVIKSVPKSSSMSTTGGPVPSSNNTKSNNSNKSTLAVNTTNTNTKIVSNNTVPKSKEIISDLQQSMLKSPAWAAWKDQNEMQRVFQGLNECENIAGATLSLEQLVSQEIRRLVELGVFPSVELALIRRETKQCREQQDEKIKSIRQNINSSNNNNNNNCNNNAESMLLNPNLIYEEIACGMLERSLCEKKLNILRARREDEIQNRETMARKLLRAKAMEEAQGKDPSNFRNQMGRR